VDFFPFLIQHDLSILHRTTRQPLLIFADASLSIVRFFLLHSNACGNTIKRSSTKLSPYLFIYGICKSPSTQNPR